ncbi:hypothetical protein BK647_03325 [Pseudomonas protegens]|nr:hypothetical protein BME99_23620 [Pseudomonas protegens]MBB1611344.1 hypothetical protein [Pseudomonas sp. UMC65]MBB1621479.1 hypothetical protein [Pseudomonas sp. UME65]OBZ20404.1 hypothetical protein BBH58_29585 [Pseudomonas protegens]OBZ21507.1 hypothetical protein BBH57_29620 [Pseudomonas protegens]
MPLAVGVFIFHARWYNFAYFWNFAHGDNFGDIQISRVSVFLYRYLLVGDISRDLISHRGYAQTAEGQN